MKKICYKKTLAIIVYFIAACFFTPVLAGESLDRKSGKILIINSNTATEKYSLTQTEFKSNIPGKKVEINLGDSQVDVAGIKNIILKTKPDIIYCIGSKAYLLAHKLAKNRKIIFSTAISWQRLPMGRNTYGIANELPSGMHLTMYRYFFPEIRKIGVIYSKQFNKEWLKDAIEEGRDVGIDIIGKQLKKPADLAPALREFLPGVDALWLTSDPVVISDRESVVEIFKQTGSMKKPVFAYSEIFARFGALMVISADVPTMGMQAAGLAGDLLANNEIPVRVANPAGSSITLNMKKVKEYGIDLNKEALDSVNRIIK